MKLSGSTAIVTGGASGIGRVTANLFAAEGAAVAIVDRARAGALEAAAELSAAGARAVAIAADVSVASEVDAMVRLAETELGPVDILVNNAAIAEGDDLLEIDEGTWDAELDVNLKGPFLCCKAVLPGMLVRRRGAIVNIASVNALGFCGHEAYSAAKAGVLSLTRSIAVRYGAYGVRANAIAPATVRTPMWDSRVERDPAVFDRLARWFPIGRVGEPEDVARAVLFLASDDASWITGAMLAVDGGYSAGNVLVLGDALALPDS